MVRSLHSAWFSQRRSVESPCGDIAIIARIKNDSVFKDRCDPDSSPGGPRTAGHRENLGGADRDRTDDLRLAKPALSQLSYSPMDHVVESTHGGPGKIRTSDLALIRRALSTD